MKAFGKLVYAIVALIGFIILRAKVFQDLWNWFITTTFNQKELSLIQAIGIGIIILLFKSIPDKEENERYEKYYIQNQMIGVTIILIAWGIGYIVHLIGE